MNKTKLYDYIKFIAFVVCFAGIPFAIVITGYYYTWIQNKSIFEKNLSREINAFFTRLEPFADQQKFWYFLFDNQINKKTKKGKNTLESIQKIANQLDILKKDYDFDYIVYNPKLGAVPRIATDTLGGSFEDWKIAFDLVWRFKKLRHIKITDQEEVIIGKVFGPQFYINHLDITEYDNKDLQLCWTDSQYKRRLIWNTFIYDCLVMTFIKPENLDNISCIKKYLETSSGELSYDFKFSINDSNNNIFFHENLSEDRKKEIESASLIYEKEHLLEIKSENYYIFPKFLRPGVTVYGYFDKADIVNIKPSIYWNLAILFCLIMVILLTIYGRNIIILHKLDKISIRWKLGFLFFFANGLPLLVLIFIGNDYLKQARADYIQKKISEGTSFLQDFDEKYELEFARSIIRKEKIKSDIINNKNSLLDENDLDRLYNGISSDTWVLFLIASQGQTLLRNSSGIFDDSYLEKSIYRDSKKKNDNKIKEYEFDKNTKSQMEFAQKLGYYLLNRFNNKPIDSKTATEIELVLETTLRRKLDNFIFEFVSKAGNYMLMGFGQNVHPGLIDTFTLKDNNLYDYFMLATIRTRYFQRKYLNKVIPQANRNELGLKVVSWNNENLFIPNQDSSLALEEFRKRLSPYPIKEPIILKHQNVNYVAMGFDCKHIERTKLIGLYPLDLIEEHVALRRNELIMFSLLSLIVTLILSSIIIKSFIYPLSAIYDGAKAIEQKNFEHQLPNLGRDEFGAMGKIFNEVIVDLEELSVAGAIQEQLLPNSEIKTGYFSLYGKSVAMGALGGDYFDFIEMEDNKFSVALGDVAGHGVGASLIMAMAKAGLITLDSLWNTPQKLIAKLHDMVYKSKTQNQRKIMTFQYMYLDGESGEGLYSNAGGCSPFIIRKSKGIVEELKLSGAVLGAFKKGKFTETPVHFDDGDAIVFYTDGVVECKNKNGVVLGYDNLKIMLQKCWDKDAKKFYNNVYNSYLEYIGGNKADAEDDVTVVILVFNKPVDYNNDSENKVLLDSD